MNAYSKIHLLACLALGGCALDEENGLDPEELTIDTIEEEVEIQTQTHYQSQSFGGNIFAENFYYGTNETCSPGHVRTTVETRWTSQVGGHCNFDRWVDPGNPHDCRANIHAQTGGGWFGGTCESWVYEEPEHLSFNFAATNTNSALRNTVNQAIALFSGQTLTVGTCGVPGSSFSGDTYLRLYDQAGIQVDASDDACSGLGSRIVYTAPPPFPFPVSIVVVRAGCFSNSTCGGTVAWTVQ